MSESPRRLAPREVGKITMERWSPRGAAGMKKLWNAIGKYGKIWENMGKNYGKTMETGEKLWENVDKTMEKPWKLEKSYGKMWTKL